MFPSPMASNVLYDLISDNKLPPCEGPKLHAFQDRNKPVEFIELLSEPPSDKSGASSGGHGHVFKVRIAKRIYALKIFKFFDVKEVRTWLHPPWSRQVSDETLVYHSDPFFAECRAYGRIDEYRRTIGGKTHRKTSPVAVSCYGYIGLPAEKYEKVLVESFQIKDWERTPEDEARIPSEKQPYRAIVKQFVASKDNLGKPSKMLGNLKKLRGLGVFPRDIFARNYKAGLLVDFSAAWTEPHWMLSILKGRQLQVRRDRDLVDFDQMLEDNGIFFSKARATRNHAYCNKLRSSQFEA